MHSIGIDRKGDWYIVNNNTWNEHTLRMIEHVIMPYQGEKIHIGEYVLERDIFLRPKKDGQPLAIYSVRRRNQ